MSTNYKLLILDYGGVYSFEYKTSSFDTIMKTAFGKSPTSNERAQIGHHSTALAKGEISSNDYVRKVAQILGCERAPSTGLFEQSTLETTLEPNPSMKELVKDLKSEGIKVSLLSDMYMFEAEHTRPQGRYEGFDYVALSAEQGMTKKQSEYFQQTLDHFGVNPIEALFVDDTLENIKVAQSIGISTIFADKGVYISAGDLIEEIYSRLGA